MKKILLTIILVVVAVILPTTLCASHLPPLTSHLPSDSIIDVPKYLIAGWWKGKDKQDFDSTEWYRNTSFIVDLRPEMLWDRGRYNHNFFNFALTYSKDFTPSSGASFGLNYANSDDVNFYFHRFGIELGYIWNISNYYYGLNMKRRYNLMATTGFELGSIKADENYRKAYYGGYLGLRFSRAFSPHTAFFIEPRLGIYSDSYDAMENPVGADAMASAHLGMNYKLSEMLYDVPPRKEIRVLHMKNWYIELGGDAFLPIPKIDYISEESGYGDRVNFGASVALGYRVNPLSTGRLRFTLSEDRFSGAKQYISSLDILFSGTNIFLGESEKRYADMALVLGPIIQVSKLPEQSGHLNWGAEVGLQFTRRITPTWELFLEPRFQLVQDYSKDVASDLTLKKRWDVNMGMVYLYEKRMKQRFDEWRPLNNWYIQSLVGAQIPTLSGGHQLGQFDFSLGRNFGPLLSLRTSLFSGELKSKEENYDETWNPMYVSYYGGRMEMVANLLSMLSPSMDNSRWNLNLSGGMEYGRLSNHYARDFAVVVGSQLQYRFTDKTWLVAGGRYEQPLKFNADLPLSAHIGMQYDLKDQKRMDILENYWRWYVQGGAGFRNAFLNKDLLAYGMALGVNMTPSQGARLEFIGSKKEKDADGTLRNWMSLSPEYVLNLSNMIFGENYDRKVDLEFFSGMDVMLHGNTTKIGFNFGTQLDAYVNDALAFFVEPRFSLQPFDKIIAPPGSAKLQYHTLMGLRYIHNRFYTRDEDKYREMFSKDYKFLEYIEEFKDWWRGWHPFAKFHPWQTIRKWHPMQNYRFIKEQPIRNSMIPMQSVYVMATWNAQLPTLTSGHQQGSFDFTFGRKLNPLWNIQASMFSGGLQSEEPNFDNYDNPMFVTYYGVRGELVFNFLRLCSRRIKDSRWNMNVSGGVEYGRLSNHHKNDYAITAASQLQYRLGSHTWLTAGGRLEKMMNFDAKLPLSGLIGFQYDLNHEKRYDIEQNNWRWYVQGGAGFQSAFWNMDRKAIDLAVGLNVTPIHGARIEYIGTNTIKNGEGLYTNWRSLSPEYVFNLSNKMLGEDDKRRMDVELFTGLDMMMHSNGFKNMEIGYNAGIQLNANIYKGISVFVQPRVSFQPSDKIIAPTNHDRLEVFTLIGLRYNHNKFKSMKPKKEKKHSEETEELEIEWQ